MVVIITKMIASVIRMIPQRFQVSLLPSLPGKSVDFLSMKYQIATINPTINTYSESECRKLKGLEKVPNLMYANKLY